YKKVMAVIRYNHHDLARIVHIYTLWISRWIATARERIPGSIANNVTEVSECSQQRGNLKDNGYITGEILCTSVLLGRGLVVHV
ncbi:hypothetical protein, partial [Photorhabdus bodei]